MASIRKYDTAKGKKWRVQFRSPDGRSRTKTGFDTKAQAQAWADKNAVSISSGEWVNPSLQKMTVNDLSEQWLAGLRKLAPSSQRPIRLAWENHVQPTWGARPVRSIRPSEVQAWMNASPLGASSVRRNHSALAQILDLAVMDGVINSNPARGLKLPKKPTPKQVFLTAEQLAFLADECSKYSSLVWVLGTVGLRWGEAAGLRVGDVNFLRGRINVAQNAVTVGAEVVIGAPKTHERRTVAVSAPVLKMLEQDCQGKLPSALVWSTQDMGPLRLPSVGSWFYEAVGRLRSRHPDFPRVTPHDLRHAAAGLLVSAGANVKVVQRQLGHKSAAMTLDTYAALFDEDLDEVSCTMAGVLSGVVKLSSSFDDGAHFRSS